MKNIFKKEVFRVFSDKKMIFSLFILPAILMFGIYGLMGMLVDSMVSDVEEHVSTVYVQNAPEGFNELLTQSGYGATAEVVYLEENASEAKIAELKDSVLNGGIDLLVVFEKGFLDKAKAYTNAGDPIPSVTLYYNSTQNYSSAARGNFNSLILEPLKTSVLLERHGNLDLLTAFNTNEELIINEEKANGEFLAMMLPYLITFLLFASAMGVCIDAIAGEKERGTMASMLLSPVKRSSLVFGKLCGLSLISALSSVVYAGSMVLAMPLMGGGEAGEALPMDLSLSPLQALELLAVMVSLVFLYVAALCLVSVFAKNAKEANAYVMPLYMIVLVLGITTMFSAGGAAPATSKYAIPVYGSALSIQGIVSNEISMMQFGASVLGNVVCTILIVVAVVKVFNNEKVMLNA